MFGENLKKIRKIKNLTQSQLGNEVNVTGAYIQQLEKGIKHKPSLELLIKLSNVLNIAPIELIENDEKLEDELLKVLNGKTDILFKTQKQFKKEKELREELKKDFDLRNAMINLIKYIGFKFDVNYDPEGISYNVKYNNIEFTLNDTEFEILLKHICNNVRTLVLESQFYEDIKEQLADPFIEDKEKK